MPGDDIVISLRLKDLQRFIGDTGRAERAVGGLSKTTNRAQRAAGVAGRANAMFGKGLGVLGRYAKYGAAAGIAGVVVETKKATDAWQESRKVNLEQAHLLKQTGGIANVTQKQIEALATAQMRRTGIDDESIKSGANMLLTFRNIRNEVGQGNDIFSQATKLATDMSVKFGGDASKSAVRLGKALNDPVRGITALRRVGIDFTKQQQDQIKTMVESGNVLGAQRMILREFQREGITGVAAAQATPLDKLKASANELQEAIGHGLQPVTDTFARSLQRVTDQAGPKIESFALGLGRMFSRKDLSLGEKLRLTKNEARRVLAPFWVEARGFGRRIEEWLREQHLGDKLSKAIEWAVPKIADASAQAAPRAVKAFVNAWLHMGTWGKLLTIGFLARRLGVFRTFGSMAAGTFATRFAATSATAVPAEMAGQKGVFSALGGKLGRWMGGALVIGLGAELGNWLVQNDVVHKIAKFLHLVKDPPTIKAINDAAQAANAAAQGVNIPGAPVTTGYPHNPAAGPAGQVPRRGEGGRALPKLPYSQRPPTGDEISAENYAGIGTDEQVLDWVRQHPGSRGAMLRALRRHRRTIPGLTGSGGRRRLSGYTHSGRSHTTMRAREPLSFRRANQDLELVADQPIQLVTPDGDVLDEQIARVRVRRSNRGRG